MKRIYFPLERSMKAYNNEAAVARNYWAERGASMEKYSKFFPSTHSALWTRRIPSFSSTRFEAAFPAMITAITLSNC